tara:strand:+ start:234 stop:875 length:642 start_codon:yes stop_codon:yes gene_type:complete
MSDDGIRYIIILSSPSGAGKTTLTKMIAAQNDNYAISVSCTTRKPRENEVEGKDYYFVDKVKFNELIKKNEFYEHSVIFNNNYGTLKKTVSNHLVKGNNVLLDIDWQGTRQIKNQVESNKLITIFILPPSIKVLKDRLVNRDQQGKEIATERMKTFKNELSHWQEYDFVVINKDLQKCYQTILEIINAKKNNAKFNYKNEEIQDKVNQLISQS